MYIISLLTHTTQTRQKFFAFTPECRNLEERRMLHKCSIVHKYLTILHEISKRKNSKFQTPFRGYRRLDFERESPRVVAFCL